MGQVEGKPKSNSSGPRSDAPFFAACGVIGGTYVVLIVAWLLADLLYTTPGHLWQALASPEIRYATQLSLLSSTASTLLALVSAVPLAYLLARTRFPGRAVVDLLLDIPIVLPPLVVGLSLLILFSTEPGRRIEQLLPLKFAVPGVILAQYAVVTAFAVRTLRATFEQIDPRTEQVALTLGCSRSQAFWRVTLPESRHGLLAAATMCWARALGEFGPVLMFAGATRMRTETLPTSIWLEMSLGNLEGAIAVSLFMIGVAVVVLLLARSWGLKGTEIVG